MRSALASVDGVEGVQVDYGSKLATVACTEECDPEALVAALEKAGFSGEVN